MAANIQHSKKRVCYYYDGKFSLKVTLERYPAERGSFTQKSVLKQRVIAKIRVSATHSEGEAEPAKWQIILKFSFTCYSFYHKILVLCCYDNWW